MMRIFHLARKEFIQTFRDRRMVGIIFIAPVIQLILFGYAATLDVDHAAFAVWDQDNTDESRALIRDFVATGSFELLGAVTSDDQIERFFLGGQGEMVLIIPPGFAADLAAGQTATAQAVFDAADSNYVSRVKGYAEGIVNAYNRRRMPEAAARLQAMLQSPLPLSTDALVDPSMRVWYNPELKSSVFMVPAIICVLLLVITMILTTLAVTREKEIGTIEHIIVTPITPWQLIIGKMTPFIVIGFVDVSLIVVAAKLLFAIPVRGSVALLYLGAACFLVTSLGLGLFFSTISRTQQQAMFLSFLFMMPAILLSGFIFPIANMPDAIQLLTYVNPLRYFLVIIRGIFLKGTGWEVLWPQFAALTGMGIAIFALAASRFSKTLE